MSCTGDHIICIQTNWNSSPFYQKSILLMPPSFFASNPFPQFTPKTLTHTHTLLSLNLSIFNGNHHILLSLSPFWIFSRLFATWDKDLLSLLQTTMCMYGMIMLKKNIDIKKMTKLFKTVLPTRLFSCTQFMPLIGNLWMQQGRQTAHFDSYWLKMGSNFMKQNIVTGCNSILPIALPGRIICAGLRNVQFQNLIIA